MGSCRCTDRSVWRAWKVLEEVQFICYSRRKKHSQSNRLGENPILFGSILTGYKWNKSAPFGAWENYMALIERQDDENSSHLEGFCISEMLDQPDLAKQAFRILGIVTSRSQHQVWSSLMVIFLETEKEKAWKERLRIMFLPCLVLGDS